MSEEMSDKYILYGGGVARDVVIRMVLQEGDIPYEVRFVDGVTGQHRTEEYRKMNPSGFIPTLITPDGTVLFETAAIMLHLAEEHSLKELVPMPGEPNRGRFLSWLFYHTSEIQPSFKRWYYPHRFSTDGVAGRETIMNRAYEMLMERWSVINSMLQEHGPYHLGERFSVLDMHMAMWATYGIKDTNDIIDAFPAIKRVVDDVTARPKSGHELIQLRQEIDRWRERTNHLTATDVY